MADLDRMAHKLMMALAGRGVFADRTVLFEVALEELARGEPVPLARLAKRAGQPLEAVAAALRGEPAVEWDEQGRLIGWGLTLRPTPFQLERLPEGLTLWTWCALDALIFPLWLGWEVHGSAQCPVSGVPIRFHLTPSGELRQVSPPSAAVVVPVPGADPDIRTAFCQRAVFLAAPDLLPAAWGPVFGALPLPEAVGLARRILGYLRWAGGIGCCVAVPMG